MIRTRPALISSKSTTVARVACTAGLLRLGWITTTPGCRVRSERVDMVWVKIPPGERVLAPASRCGAEPVTLGGRRAAASYALMALAGVVELVDTPALGAGGRSALGRSSRPARIDARDVKRLTGRTQAIGEDRPHGGRGREHPRALPEP